MIFDAYKPIRARKFLAASSQYMTAGTAVVTAVPVTMACWAKLADTANNHVPVGVFDVGTDSADSMYLDFAGAAGDILRAVTAQAGTFRTAATTDTFLADVWYHGAAVFSSTTNRLAYLNGKPGATDTNSSTPGGLVNTYIGRYYNSSTDLPMNGEVAWPAIWNVALNAGEIARLASGAHPQTIRPESLVAFWDFTGAQKEFGLRAAYPMADVNGSTTVKGPGFLVNRMPRPWLLGSGFVDAAAGGGPLFDGSRLFGGGTLIGGRMAA